MKRTAIPKPVGQKTREPGVKAVAIVEETNAVAPRASLSDPVGHGGVEIPRVEYLAEADAAAHTLMGALSSAATKTKGLENQLKDIQSQKRVLMDALDAKTIEIDSLKGDLSRVTEKSSVTENYVRILAAKMEELEQRLGAAMSAPVPGLSTKAYQFPNEVVSSPVSHRAPSIPEPANREDPLLTQELQRKDQMISTLRRENQQLRLQCAEMQCQLMEGRLDNQVHTSDDGGLHDSVSALIQSQRAKASLRAKVRELNEFIQSHSVLPRMSS